MGVIEAIEALKKALEEGGYNVCPSKLKQGSGHWYPTAVVEAHNRGETLPPEVECAEWKAVHERFDGPGSHYCEYCRGK